MPIRLLNINGTQQNKFTIFKNSNVGNVLMLSSNTTIPVTTNGSAVFAGTTTSKLTTSGSADVSMQFGTGSFTIEWWQNLSAAASSFPRIFEQASGPMVSMEGSSASRTFYFWAGASFTAFGSVTSSINGVWNHFAVVRSGSGAANVKVYRNGVQQGNPATITTNFTSTNPLTIGNRTAGLVTEAYSGSLTNFHWLKGIAKYTASFTPTGPLIAISGSSALLLLTTDSASLNIDSSGYNRTIINTSTTFTSSSPF
jgi:hypothetical protein